MNQTKEASLWQMHGLWALLLLTFINLFNYLDRYILVALSPSIQKDLSLSDLQVGFLATAFMFSYFLVAPLFGWLGDRKPRYPLMAVGVGLWSLATAASGLVRGYLPLLATRLCVGVGEAAYGAISPSLLTDLYPKSVRGRVFAIFFMAIPVGSALGYLLGGFLEKSVGWRMAFLVAGLPGVLMALLLFFFRDPKRGAFESEPCERLSLTQLLLHLGKNSSYVLTVLGYCAYTFVLGGVAVWIPHYIERYLGVAAADGNMAFGAITVAAGFLGTFVGGAWADRWAARSTDGYLKLSFLSMFLALPVFLFSMNTSSFSAFCVWIFLLEFLLFLSTSPVNAQIVNCISPSIRASGNAISIFLIHLLGDAISPPMVGWISGFSDLRTGMMIFPLAIFLSGFIWLVKVVFFWDVVAWPKAIVLAKIQCHRGFHFQGIQENTLRAFREAKARGAKMVELDVQLSKDGIPVVIHDPDIVRIAGVPGLVRDLTAAELFQRAGVPSLEEVVRDPELEGLQINCELKSDCVFNNGLEKAVARVVQLYASNDRILFSSFNPFSLRRISKELPDYTRALLVTQEPNRKNKFYLKKMLLAFLARPHMLNLDHRYLTEKDCVHLASRKIPFAVWTLEDSSEAKKYLDFGAISLISPKLDLI